MKSNYFLSVLTVLLVGFLANSSAVRQQECLDPACIYILGYDPNLEKEEITFDVLVKTTGYIGFGLSSKGSMKSADIVIGGIKDDTVYFQDYHGEGNFMPTVDASQDWQVLEARANSTHTYLKFTRFFHTCDKVNDVSITADTINVIWSYGATDDIAQHANRGARQFLLLDPPPPFSDLSPFDIHEIRVRNTVPKKKTSYLCSFHKFPKFENQKYLVGVEAFLENQDAVQHTHHFSVTTCRMDDTSDLERLLAETAVEAQDCFEELLWIRPFCNEVLFGWAVGGKRVMLPEHVGVPFGEASSGEGDGSLYIMLEVHYENPTERFGVTYTTGFDTYYTGQKREFDGSIIMVGHEVNPSLLIPPKSTNHVVAGHCSSEITQEFIPEGGIKVIAVNMHSHIAGREIRVRHFRDGVELPWLLNDQNYDFDYQQTRELRQEMVLLPGDHLINECIFNTMDRDVITLGGESTFEEMCHTYLVYYPRIELRGCKSNYPLNKLWPKFNITGVALTEGNLFNPTITAPESMRGKLFSEVLNSLEWTDELKEEIQRDLRYGNHTAMYAAGDYDGGSSQSYLEENYGVPKSYGVKGAIELPDSTAYPDVDDYKPAEPKCNGRQISTISPLPLPEAYRGGSSQFLSNFHIVGATLLITLNFWL